MRRLCLLLALAAVAGASPALAAPVVLPVETVAQEQDQWCWAATTRCALLHFGVDQSQCLLVEYTRTHTDAPDLDLGATDCCSDATQGCNRSNYFWHFAGSIADLLGHFGDLRYSTFDRPLTLAEFTEAIDVQRLVFVRWAWPSGGGHFILGHGYDGSALYYMDPWPGEGPKIGEYDWLRSGSTHTWATTLTTGTPRACQGLSDGARCDDFDACTLGDTCSGGACLGQAVTCDAPRCQKSLCDSATGACAAATFLANGTSCDDGDPCTENDACTFGACGGTAKVCGASECRATLTCSRSSGECVGTPLPDGTACSGGSCQAGACVARGSSCASAPSGPLAALAALGLFALARRRRG